jgi:hypothetical protein
MGKVKYPREFLCKGNNSEQRGEKERMFRKEEKLR